MLSQKRQRLLRTNDWGEPIFVCHKRVYIDPTRTRRSLFLKRYKVAPHGYVQRGIFHVTDYSFVVVD